MRYNTRARTSFIEYTSGCMPAENSDDGLCKLMMLNLSCSAATERTVMERLTALRLSGPSRQLRDRHLEPVGLSSAAL